MEKEKVLQFLKNKGTLGVLTLCLVGATAFATYQVSYQEQQQIVEEQEDQAAEEKEASVENVQAQLVKKSDADGIVEMDVNPALMTDETGALNASDPDEESVQTEETVDVSSANIRAQLLPTVNFTEDSLLVWPAAGTILMDYNMNGTVYFKTLDQYKYNPALIIASEVGNPVVASARGIVESIGTNEETGATVTLNLGNQYSLTYGQLKEIAVTEGEVVEQGQLLGYVSEPTKYYCEEGSNLYFQVKKDGQPVDPFLYLE